MNTKILTVKLLRDYRILNNNKIENNEITRVEKFGDNPPAAESSPFSFLSIIQPSSPSSVEYSRTSVSSDGVAKIKRNGDCAPK